MKTWVRVLAATLLAVEMATGEGPVFQAETRIVEVAIVAKDSHDAPVTDLTVDDFRVFDNGVEQKILSFDKLWDPPRAADGLPIGLPPKRRSVILIDNLNGGGAPVARAALADTLRAFPQAADRLSIYTLGDELKVMKDFTPYTMGLRMAVEEYGGEEPATPRANWFLWTLQALRMIANDLKNIPGEKNLVWLTSGFRVEDYPDVARAMRELASARVMVYPVDVSGLKLLPPARELAKLPWQTAGAELRRDGESRAEARAASDGMYELAELTGGRVFDDSNDLPGLIRAAIDDSREGFVLTYAPGNYRKDGSAHEVRLKTERKGLDLRYRPGYTADSEPK